MTERIICVDDEPLVLAALQRHLHERFDISTATSGAAALELIASDGPFAVIVSDMRMPEMDGIAFLAAAKKHAPNSVRIMLTGNADQQTAIEAVNEGNIFRFLTKPCAPEALAKALEAGVAQYRLVAAEKELLEKTLRGAIKVLVEVLALTNPAAFGRATRVQQLVSKLCEQMGVERPWRIEIAAMLSQIGCVTLPPDILEKAQRGGTLPESEARMLEAHPGVAADLIRNIPRLEEVARIVSYQSKRFDGSGVPRDSLLGTQIPLGARILNVAIDHDALTAGGRTSPVALAELRRRPRWYDPAVLDALHAVVSADQAYEMRELALKDVTPHAVLAEDVRTPQGRLLISKGQEITPSVYNLLCNYARRQGLENQIHVRVYVEKHATQPVATS